MKFIQLLVAIVLLTPSVVFGGFAGDGVPVQIDWEEQEARGIMSVARFTDNPDEQIGCSANYWELEGGGFYSFAACRATLGGEEDITCFTENAEFVDKIAGLNHYSWLSFRWEWDAALEYNKCTVFRFSTRSHHIPEFILKKIGKK